jgi:N-methylhydantoinase A
VVLGILAPGRELGGTERLDRDAARDVVARNVAEPLGMSCEQAAAALVRLANANMAQALRTISIARGHDPRRFVLVAIGGAGPMHGCEVADELGITRVIVPRHPGVSAALGLLVSDVRHDLRHSWLRTTGSITPSELDDELARLEEKGRELLARSGHEGSAARISFELDMRYHGQAYNLTVAVPRRPVTDDVLAETVASFVAMHEALYDYTPAVAETQIVTVRAQAVGELGSVSWVDAGRDGTLEPRERDVWMDGAWRSFTVVDRNSLAAGDALGERTIVDQEDTTVVLPSGWSGRLGPAGVLMLLKEPS